MISSIWWTWKCLSCRVDNAIGLQLAWVRDREFPPSVTEAVATTIQCLDGSTLVLRTPFLCLVRANLCGQRWHGRKKYSRCIYCPLSRVGNSSLRADPSAPCCFALPVALTVAPVAARRESLERCSSSPASDHGPPTGAANTSKLFRLMFLLAQPLCILLSAPREPHAEYTVLFRCAHAATVLLLLGRVPADVRACLLLLKACAHVWHGEKLIELFGLSTDVTPRHDSSLHVHARQHPDP